MTLKTIPDLHKLEEATREIVREGKRTGQLSVLTPRIIRSKIEELFSLEPRTLDAKEYKETLKQVASDEALRENDESKNDGHVKVRPTNKRKSDTQENLEPTKSAKMTKAAESKAKAEPSTNKESKTFKSAEFIPSSDEEDNGEGNRQEPYMRDERRNEQPGVCDSPKEVTHSSSVPVGKQEPTPEAVTSTNEDKIGEDSDSELSVLIDEPPKVGKKSKTKDKAAPNSKGTISKQKRSTTEVSKDDKTIARLKSMVLACGVRKVWTKEFQNASKPSQQIKRLKEILTALGMSGRFTLQQARSIKEKRELAQELEDVQSFQKLVTSTGTHSRAPPPSDHESEDEVRPKRKGTARERIMAFLGDEESD